MHRRSERSDKSRRVFVERLKEVIESLSGCCGAEEIILFGSYARGDYRKDSSIDLLVIANTDLPFVERIVRAIECVPDGDIGVEVLVYTPEEISAKLNEKESFVTSAMHEGILVWSRQVDFGLEEQLKNATSAAHSEYFRLLREAE